MLEVKNLTKIYKPKSGAAVKALDGVSLKLADKGLVFLLGKSGSGKSTLLNLMGGLDTYTGGDIIIKGKSSQSFKQSDFDSYRNTYIGFIFQEFNILEDYTVGKNIGLALELQHKKSDDEAINNILKQVDLEGYKDRKPNELSGGQKQRVAIARALIKSPEIIMGDEPTGSLDSKTGRQVFDTLKKLSKDKLVVVVSHDRENAEFYGDRVIELADGVVISDRIRSKESGQLENMPIDYISPDLIKIEGGYQLTQNDISKINQMLAKTKGDIFISSDEGISSHIKTTKNLTTANSKGSFVATTNENYHVKTYDKSDFKLVKSKLPLKDGFKMGASGLKLKKIRLAFTIILSFFAFFLFGFSNTAAAIDSQQSQMRTLAALGAKAVMIESQSGRTDFGGSVYWNNWDAPGISAKQIEDIEALINKPILKLVERQTDWGSTEKFYLGLGANIRDRNATMGSYYAQNIENFVEVPSIESLGLTPANGAANSKLPTEFDEIAITDYIADTFVDFGFVEYTFNASTNNYESTQHTITSYGDLIGKHIGSSDKLYKITGVYNTGFDMADFEKYKTIMDGLGSMTASSFSSMIFGMGFVKEGFTENWKTSSGGTQNLILPFPNSILKLEHKPSEQMFEQQFYYLENAERAIDSNYVHWINGKTKSNFSDDDIIIGGQLVGLYYDMKDLSTAIENFVNEFEQQGIYYLNGDLDSPTSFNIAGIYIHDYSNDKEITYPNDIVFVHNSVYDPLYEEYLKAYESTIPVNLNNYGLGNFTDSTRLFSNYVNQAYKFNKNASNNIGDQIYFKDGIEKDKLEENQIIIPYHFFIDYNDYKPGNELNLEQTKPLLNSLSSYTCSLGRLEWIDGTNQLTNILKENLEIVGISYNFYYVSDTLYSELQALKGDTMRVIVPLSGNFNEDKDVFDYIFSQEIMDGRYGSRLQLINTLTPLMSMLEREIPVLRTVFLYISLAFSLFAALLLMNFIGVSINHKKKDIGVLRAIGARSTDVFAIFFFESLIIGAINFVLSVAAVVILSIVLNTLMGVVIFVPGVLQIFLMFALCFSIALISTYLPVRKIAHKKPIDAINNR